MPVGAKLSNPLSDGSGTKIIGCRLGNTRSRGIILKCDHALVQNNVIEGCGMAAISLGPEYYWNEANYVQNVTISGNTLTGAAHWPEMMDKKSPISLSNCKSVTLRGNSVVNASVYRATLVEVGTNVTGLQGREEVWKSNFTGPTPPAPSTPRS